MSSHFESFHRFSVTPADEIHTGATLHAAYPIKSIPCLLMLWWLQEPGHYQVWYWPNKPEYSVFSIRRVKTQISLKLVGTQLISFSYPIIFFHFFHSDTAMLWKKFKATGWLKWMLGTQQLSKLEIKCWNQKRWTGKGLMTSQYLMWWNVFRKY